jgi:hypothetical protein
MEPETFLLGRSASTNYSTAYLEDDGSDDTNSNNNNNKKKKNNNNNNSIKTAQSKSME